MAAAVRLPSLTGFRFFLALWVIVFHQCFAWLSFPNFRPYMLDIASLVPAGFWPVIDTGYVAVSVFFILSGFVLSYNYSLSERWQVSRYTQYLVHRFARIYPVYVLGLLLISPFILYNVVKWRWIEGLQTLVKSLLLNLALLQSWNPNQATSWNFPGWSLSNEAFYYCCFPWVGILLWRLSASRAVVAAWALWAVAMAVPLAATYIPLSWVSHSAAAGQHLDADPFWSMFVQYDPVLRLPDFCIGIVLGRIYHLIACRQGWLLGRGYWLYGAGFVLEGFAITYGNSSPHLWMMNGLFTPLHSLVILGLALGGGPVVKMLSLRPLVFLGNASYAMYILHAPIFLWMFYLFHRFLGGQPGGVWNIIIYLLITCLVSGAVYKYFEEPVNHYLRRRFTWRPAKQGVMASSTMPTEAAAQRAFQAR